MRFPAFVCLVLASVSLVAGCNNGKSILLTIVTPNGAQTLDLGQSFTITVQVNHDGSGKGATFTLSGVGTLTGTSATGATYNAPTTGPGGTATITIASAAEPAKTATITVTVTAPPTLSAASLATAIMGAAYNASVAGTGGAGALTYSVTSGSLPGGLSLSTSTGAITGTPAGPTGTVTFTIQVKDSSTVSPQSASKSYSITVDQQPSITSANSAIFTAGVAGTFTVTTTAAPTAAVTETGTLPTGVTFTDNGNGTATIAGTSSASGAYPITINASNGVGTSATQSFTFIIGLAAGITSTNKATFTVGRAGVFTVTTTGFPKPRLTESGALPSGVTFNDNGDGTAKLAGTPASGSGGIYAFTITAHNGVGANATQSFTLTVNEAPSITSANSTAFSVSAAGSFTVTTHGFPAPLLAETGALPSGVTFTDNHNGTATLAGTPASGTNGSYPITITATNGMGSPATQTFTLTVNTGPVITSAPNTTFTVGTAGTFKVTATGTPTPSLTETGTLPSGVTFKDNGDGTGTLAGTPAAGTGKTYAFTLKATNSVGSNSQSFTLTVDQTPAFTTANSTTFTEGASSSFSVMATGFPAPTITVSGALPSGVTFPSSATGSGVLGGTPASGSNGTYNITFTASNGVGGNATQSFTLTVNTVPVFTSANNTTFTVGTAGTFTIATVGTPTPKLTETGTLPSGVTFTDNGNGTATLKGTPGAGTGGKYSITVNASSSSGNASQGFFLYVDQAPAITSANSTTFALSGSGLFKVTTNGYPVPSLTETGALPSGVTFVDNGDGTATLSGTPASGTTGTYPITINANNSVTPNASQSFTLTVAVAPACALSGKQFAIELTGNNAAGPAALLMSINVATDGSITGESDFRSQTTLSASKSVSGPAGSCSDYSVAGTGTLSLSDAGTPRTIKFAMRSDDKKGFVVESDSTGFNATGQIRQQTAPTVGLASGSYAYGVEGASTSLFAYVTGAFCTDSSNSLTFLQSDFTVNGTFVPAVTASSNPGALSAADAQGRVTTTSPFSFANGTTADLTIYNVDGTKAFVLVTAGSFPNGTGGATPIPVEVGFISGKQGAGCLPTTSGAFTNSSIGNSVFSTQGVDGATTPLTIGGFIGVLTNFNATAGTVSVYSDQLIGGIGKQSSTGQTATYSVSPVGRFDLGTSSTSHSYAYLDGAGTGYVTVGNNGQGIAFGFVSSQTAVTPPNGSYAFGTEIGTPFPVTLALLPVTEVSINGTTIADLTSGGSSGTLTCDMTVGRCTGTLNNNVTFGDAKIVAYVAGNSLAILQTTAGEAQPAALSH